MQGYRGFLSAAVLVLGLSAGCHQTVKPDNDYGPLTSADDAVSGKTAGDGASSSSTQANGADKQAAETRARHKRAMAATESHVPPSKLPFQATGPVAVVDGKPITAAEFNAAVEKNAAMLGGHSFPKRFVDAMVDRTLDKLIDKRLINKQLAAAKLPVSSQEVDRRLADFEAKFRRPAAFRSFLKRNHLTRAALRERLRKDLALRKLLEKTYGAAVTDKDVRDYYDQHPQRFTHDSQVRARHILIKVSQDASPDEVAKARKRAEAIAKEAKKPGADFATLAKKTSEGPSASRGGDLGFFTRTRMVAKFSTAAFAMKPGEVSGPVRTRFGFHIIKVEARKSAGKTPFSEAKGQIRTSLERRAYRKSLKAFLTKLHKNAHIQRNKNNIQINVPHDDHGRKLNSHGRFTTP